MKGKILYVLYIKEKNWKDREDVKKNLLTVNAVYSGFERGKTKREKESEQELNLEWIETKF